MRRDLLEKAGLKPPRTRGTNIRRWSNRSSKSGAGTVGRRAVGTGIPCDAVSGPCAGGGEGARAAFSVFFDIDTGEPLIDSPGFVRASGNR